MMKKILKYVTSACLCTIMIISTNNFSYAETVKYESAINYVVNASSLNVREDAGTDATAVGSLPEGTPVNGWKENGTWVYVSSDTLGGWVHKDYLITKEEATKKQVSRGGYSRTSSGYVVDSITSGIVSTAQAQLGKKYKYGSAGPNTFDCSGLTTYVFAQQGISLPRSSSSYGSIGQAVGKSDVRAGDIVCFNTSGKGISHVGIAIGGTKFIHAATGNTQKVITSDLNETYYKSRLVTIRRVY